MDKEMKKIKLKVMGEKIVVPLDILEINNIDESMSRAGYLMAYWGEILSQAEKEFSLAESHYRNWRANEGRKHETGKEKMTIAKIENLINSDPKFLQYKEALATAQYNVSVLLRFYDALKTQAYILPSKGARKREEMKALGMSTKGK
jgi:hypothetical protein